MESAALGLVDGEGGKKRPRSDFWTPAWPALARPVVEEVRRDINLKGNGFLLSDAGTIAPNSTC